MLSTKICPRGFLVADAPLDFEVELFYSATVECGINFSAKNPRAEKDDSGVLLVPPKWYYLTVLIDWADRLNMSETAIDFLGKLKAHTEKADIYLGKENVLVIKCSPDYQSKIGAFAENWQRMSRALRIVSIRDDNNWIKDNPEEEVTGLVVANWSIEDYDRFVNAGFTSHIEDEPVIQQYRIKQVVNMGLEHLARDIYPEESTQNFEAIQRISLNGYEAMGKYQTTGVQYCNYILSQPENKGVIVADNVGLGKTWISLATAKYRGKKPFVVCPANLVPNWREEIAEKFGSKIVMLSRPTNEAQYVVLEMLDNDDIDEQEKYDMCSGFLLIIEGTTVDPLIARVGKYFGSIIVAHSILTKWEKVLVDLISVAEDFCIIFDEADNFKGAFDGTSALGKTYLKLGSAIKKSENETMVMTATLLPKQITDVWPHINLCYPNSIGENREVYLNRYRGMPTLFHEDYKGHILFRTHVQVPEMPRYKWHTSFSVLPEEGQKMYDDLVAAMYEYLTKRFGGGEAPRIVVMNYLRQVVGRLKAQFITPSIKQMLKGHKAIIFGHHHHVLEKLAKDFGTDPMSGRMTKEKQHKLREKFNKSDGQEVLVAGIQMAAGWSVFADTVYFAELSWQWKAIEQAAGRAIRVNNPNRKINIYMSALSGTFEEKMWTIYISYKKALAEAIMWGKELPENNTAEMMEEVLLDLFPGINFADGEKVSDDVKDEMDAIVNRIFGKVIDVNEDVISFTFNKELVQDKFLAPHKIGQKLQTIIDGQKVNVLRCHAAEDGKLSERNEILLNKMPEPKMVISCYPQKVADRYGVNVINHDWKEQVLEQTYGKTATYQEYKGV